MRPEILRDDQKRGAYDRFGHAAFEQNGGAAGQGGASGLVALVTFLKKCLAILWRWRRKRQTGGNNQRGADRRYDFPHQFGGGLLGQGG